MAIVPTVPPDMTRRAVLGIIGGAGIGSVSWLSDGESKFEPTCQPNITVVVVAVANVSEGETVYDAEADGFTYVGPVADALAEAHNHYEDGKAVDADELDDLTVGSDQILAQKRATTDLLVAQDLLINRPLVTYQGQIYQLSHPESDC